MCEWKTSKEAEGLNMGQSTLEASVTLGDQRVTFQQASDLRAPQSHTSCFARLRATIRWRQAASALGECFLSRVCSCYMRIINGLWWLLEARTQHLQISKLYRVDVMKGKWISPEMSLQACSSDWPDGNFLCALTERIWFSDGKTCQMKSKHKGNKDLLKITLLQL